jgi:PIN domain nuclease of toxin-antitoxin system
MAGTVYLDTHVVTWLYAGRVELLPERASQLINESTVVVSPMVALELEYLFEIGRTTRPSEQVMNALSAEIGLRACELAFENVIQRALSEAWTRDPFDRIIVSQAALRNLPLISKDQSILDNYKHAVWE